MTPETILKDDLARASRAKNQDKQKSENQIVASEVMLLNLVLKFQMKFV